MYSESITLFNHYSDRLGETWYPHVLKNVDLIVDRASIVAKYGNESSSSAKLHVKYEDGEGIHINGVPYLGLVEWKKLTTEERAEYITFNTDTEAPDFFVLGEVEADKIIFDSAESMTTLLQRMAKEQEVYILTTASAPYKVIKHFEILARG